MIHILHTVRAFLERDLSSKPEGRILVGLSGGPDSVALLSLLHDLGQDVGAVHVNFRLREAAEKEEELVRALCLDLGIPLWVKRAEPGTIYKMEGSVQMAARDFRYAFFAEVAENEGFAWIATAHHLGDQTETLLLSLLKGGAPGVLNGIPKQAGKYIRPLLGITKAELVSYLGEKGLPFATDASNQGRDYLRNQIRLDVIPELAKVNPGFGRRLGNLAAQLTQRQAYMSATLLTDPGVVDVPGEGWELRFADLTTPEPFWPLVLEQVLIKLGFFGLEIEQALLLVQSDVGKGRRFRLGHVLRTSIGLVIRPHGIRNDPTVRILNTPLEIAFSQFASGFEFHWKGNQYIECWLTSREDAVAAFHDEGVYFMDADKLQFPLTFRCWEEGDRIQPLGMEKRKKLSDVFSEMGIDRLRREEALVVSDVERIVLVGGYRISEAVRVGEESASLLAIRIVKIDLKALNDDVHA